MRKYLLILLLLVGFHGPAWALRPFTAGDLVKLEEIITVAKENTFMEYGESFMGFGEVDIVSEERRGGERLALGGVGENEA